MSLDISDPKVQKVCFLFKRLIRGSLPTDEAERLTKEIGTAAACYLADNPDGDKAS